MMRLFAIRGIDSHKIWFTRIGRLLTFLALGFLLFELYRNRHAFGNWRPSPVDLAVLGGLCCAYTAAIFAMALNWHLIVQSLASEVLSLRLGMRSYTMTQIGKYIPGNVAHFVGRHVVLNRAGLGHKSLLFGTGIEITVMVLAAVVVALVFMVRRPLVETIPFAGAINALTPYLLSAVFLLWIGGILGSFFPAQGKWRVLMLCALPLSATFMIVMSSVFFMILWHITSTNVDFGLIVTAACVGWLIGFLTPGSPGGLGMREAVILLLLQADVAQPLLLLALVLFRLLTVTGDLLCYAVGEIILKERD